MYILKHIMGECQEVSLSVSVKMEFGKSVFEAENKTWEIEDGELSIIKYRNAGYMSGRPRA